ncbi:hypothetical protein OG762_26695 [Streptomyces sp. NBC_01136]|uniref:hypothetical protein n=1 Tax=Streptomyces sp. NBC_01136 TaxID=2903754 RepID=UPI003869F80D|nr:hypothetical protein OG762_26695 [Streptomyces sp. NBC_01136]
MTTGPEEKDGSQQQDSAPWRLPSYIWHPTVRRAWLEAAEQAWTEGYAERFERGRLQRIVLKLLYWRGIEAPPDVNARVFATTDLERLQILRDRSFEVTDPADLFTPEAPA